jgi:hypothetical protein
MRWKMPRRRGAFVFLHKAISGDAAFYWHMCIASAFMGIRLQTGIYIGLLLYHLKGVII